jgi:hypothetical protein
LFTKVSPFAIESAIQSYNKLPLTVVSCT